MRKSGDRAGKKGQSLKNSEKQGQSMKNWGQSWKNGDRACFFSGDFYANMFI